eukprot:gene33452-43236_t
MKRLLQWQPSDDGNCLSTNLEYVIESELISDSVFIPTTEEPVVVGQMTTSETMLNGDENKEEHPKKKIRNRRKNSKTNWVSEFTKMICNGKNEVATELIQQFFALNGTSDTKMEADAMIRAFITKGAKEDMLRMVLKIGGDRYRRLRENRPVKEKGNSRNSNAVSHDIIEQLNRMVQTISIEEGYSSCSHRRKLFFITDVNISSWQALYEQCYKPFEPDETIRKVGFTTFYNHMRAHHPNLRLNRLKEDFCDLCIPRKVESTSKAPSSDDS